jgi:hypothetical protein
VRPGRAIFGKGKRWLRLRFLIGMLSNLEFGAWSSSPIVCPHLRVGRTQHAAKKSQKKKTTKDIP